MGPLIRQCTIVIAILMSSAGLHAQSMGKESLRGLTGVMVMVEDIGQDIEEDGLKKSTIEDEVEEILHSSGIEALSEKELKKTVGAPFLYISVSCGNISPEVYAYTVSVELVQSVLLVRDINLICNATTWKSTRKIGTVDADDVDSLEKTIRYLLSEFVYDHSMANMKG